MSTDDGITSRLVAKVKALFPQDWVGRAGERFRKTTQVISIFTKEHDLRPENLLEDGLVLGRRKLEGLASQEHSAAEKNYGEALRAYAETEDCKIETEIKKRTLESKVLKEEAETRIAQAGAKKAEADARIAQVHALNSELELLAKLQSIGVTLHSDERGDLTVLPLPPNLNLLDVAKTLTHEVVPQGSPEIPPPSPPST